MPLSEEESDFLRLLILVVKVAPLAVRHLFNQKFPPSNLGADLQSNKAILNNLKTKRIINSAQWDLLFPPSGSSTCSTTFDVTLLICLLRNIKPAGSSTPAIPPPLTGFDKLPQSTDHSSGADLARIKHFRNFLAHHKEAKIAKTEFNSAWTDLCEGIKRIGGGNYNQECTDLRVASLDESQKEVYKEILRTQAELESMKTEFHGEVSKTQSEIESVKRKAESELASVKKKTRSELMIVKKKTRSELMIVKKKLAAVKSAQEEKKEIIPKHLKETHTSYVNGWEKEEKTFTVTRATKQVANLIKENNVVVVVGSSGSGKSSIIHHVALNLKTEHGYDIIPIVTSPVDIIQYRDVNKNQLFVIDDLCGKNYLDETDLEAWKNKSKIIEELFPEPSNERGKLKILVSCRLQIFNTDKFKNLHLFTKEAVDLQSQKYCLVADEKLKMIQKYLKVTEEDWQEINKDLAGCQYFPLLCKLGQDKNVEEFKHLIASPIDCIRKDLRDTIQNKPMENCALVLCVLFSDGFHEDFIDPETRPQDVQQKITDIINTYEINLANERNRAHLSEAFERLDGTYVKKIGQEYSISHDKLSDMVAVECSNKVTELFIKYSPPTILEQLFRFRTLFEYNQDELLIYLKEKDEKKYFNRIFKDLQVNSYKPFFHNQQLKEEKYRTKVMEYIEQNRKSCDKLFRRLDREGMTEKRKDIGLYCETYHTTPVIEAAKTGFYDLVQYLININCDCNEKDNYEYGYSPLHYSCDYGFVNVTDLLMRHGVEYCDELVDACWGEIDGLRVLLDRGVDLSVQHSEFGWTPLVAACHYGISEVVKLLLDKGADPLQTDDLGWTPLAAACSRNGCSEVVKLLLDKGADPLQTDCGCDGSTPLIEACTWGHNEIVKLLLDKGADPLQTDRRGRTALDVAREWEEEEWGEDTIINLLKSHMKQ